MSTNTNTNEEKVEDLIIPNVDLCVCCGAYVPEVRQVCWDCENN